MRDSLALGVELDEQQFFGTAAELAARLPMPTLVTAVVVIPTRPTCDFDMLQSILI
jgi:hypothetical protein